MRHPIRTFAASLLLASLLLAAAGCSSAPEREPEYPTYERWWAK